MKPIQKLEMLLASSKVVKSTNQTTYLVKESEIKEAYDAIESGEYLLKKGNIYILVSTDGVGKVYIAGEDEPFDVNKVINAGGGGVSDEGVSSVTGEGVDNSDSRNPKISFPTPEDIGAVSQTEMDEKVVPLATDNFLVGGSEGNTGRKIKPEDLNLTVNSSVLTRGASGELGQESYSSEPSNNTIPVRTASGTLKTAPAVEADESVTLSQYQSGLEGKVDKESGKGLSDSNFTLDEKQKLAGLEDVHYKGWFPSLTALEAKYPTAEEGSHAFVDDVDGSTLYIWDLGTTSWEARVGESTEVTASQVKTLYESNPDTNAFTNDLKSKLESITSSFTTALKTTYDNAVSWINANKDALLNHLSAKNNPHEVTASQVGLGNVDNTRDIDKPLSTATKNYVDNTVNKVWTPDYGNMETTSKITSSGGTWTSDKTGFVYVLSRGYNAGIYNTEVVSINGREVGRIWVEAQSGSGNARSGSFTNIYPVKVGDTVLVRGNLEVKCLFIPGIWV